MVQSVSASPGESASTACASFTPPAKSCAFSLSSETLGSRAALDSLLSAAGAGFAAAGCAAATGFAPADVFVAGGVFRLPARGGGAGTLCGHLLRLRARRVEAEHRVGLDEAHVVLAARLRGRGRRQVLARVGSLHLIP